MKVLLIGGGGFIGVWLTKALVDAGHYVRIVGRSPLPEEKWAFLLRDGWGGRQRSFRETVDRRDLLMDVDAIVPLAWLLGSVASDENPMGSLESAADVLALLHALVEFDLRPLVVFPSSHLAPKPRCLYALHKVLTEGHLEYYWRVHGIPYIALRTAKAYGPLQRRGVIDFYIRRGLAGGKLPVYGQGQNRVALIYVGDAARGLKWAIEGKFPRNKIHNLVGHNHTITQIAEAVVELVGGTVERCVPWPDLDKVLDAGDLPLDNDLARWGWEPICGLKGGIARTTG